MIPLALQLLAADGGFVLHASGKLRDGNALAWELAAGTIAIASLSATIVWLTSAWLKARHKKSKDSPQRLWKDLCAAHRLNRRERNLLARLVEHHHLLQPATLFVEPRLWEGELPFTGTRRISELVSLREKLFRHA